MLPIFLVDHPTCYYLFAYFIRTLYQAMVLITGRIPTTSPPSERRPSSPGNSRSTWRSVARSFTRARALNSSHSWLDCPCFVRLQMLKIHVTVVALQRAYTYNKTVSIFDVKVYVHNYVVELLLQDNNMHDQMSGYKRMRRQHQKQLQQVHLY